MLIDWFTVSAQAVNFLILVWLLKRFLYKPILQAIDEREKRIAGLLHEAEVKRAEAQQERDEFRRRNQTFEEQRASLSSRAEDEIKAHRQKLLESARKEAGALRAKLDETWRAEQESVRRDLAVRTQQEVFAIARKSLADLAGASLEERIAEVFVRRLGELDGDEAGKPVFASARGSSRCPALVRSAFPLPPAQRAAIERAVREKLPDGIQVQFETAPEVIGGIELTLDGRRVSWSIADYLETLERSVVDPVECKHATVPS